jgi:hypothetical protein
MFEMVYSPSPRPRWKTMALTMTTMSPRAASGVSQGATRLRPGSTRPAAASHSATPPLSLAALIEAGAGDRLMVSHDWSVLGVSRTSDPLASRGHNPDGWLFATRKLFPRLRALGIGQEQVDRLNRDNPRRFLGG